MSNFTIAFIHPRYLMREDSPKNKKLFLELRTNQQYGSYESYLQHLSGLHASLTNPSIFFCDVHKGKPHPYHTHIMPRPQDLLIDWTSTVGTGDTWDMCFQGMRIQRKSLARFLKEKEITKIALAGECGPCENSLQGCVGTIHELLSPSMEVRGIQGCIYPQVAYRKHLEDALAFGKELWNWSLVKPIQIKQYKKMLIDLYDNALTPSFASPQS